MTASPKPKADGTLLWDGAADVTVYVGGKPVPARATVKLTIKGSAGWPD